MLENSTTQLSFVNFLADKPGEKKEDKLELEFETADEADRYHALLGAVEYVRQRWQIAKDARSTQEAIWMNAWRQFRGEYSPEETEAISKALSRNPNASRIFVKITKTKANAALGQLLEVLESDSRFPITVEATPVPDGVPEHAYLENEQFSAQTQEDVYGYAGDGREIDPGATAQSLLKGQFDKFKNFLAGKQVKEGPSPDKNQVIQLNPAQRSAEEMDKVIQDQLVEAHARHAVRRACLEQVIYGTGLIKGPMSEEKVIHDWERNPDSGEITYSPIYKLAPRIDYVSIWNFYPDPDAKEMGDAEWVIERHLMSKSQLRALRNQPTFARDAIDRVLEIEPTYSPEGWENQLQDTSSGLISGRYEVLEYWGYVDADLAARIGLNVSNSLLDSVQVNLWVSHGEVIRAVINPFVPANIPYYPVPYEESPHQIWGIGICENMSDAQSLMNGHMRMAIDNLRLAGNVIYEINQDSLVPGQNLDMYPGKVIYTQTPAVGQSVYTIQFNNTAQEHIQMYDKARQLADEKTGIPSYSHGQTGVSGMSRTAAGMSMLMGASALNIKTVIKNWDHHLLRKLGEALFAWNMQFNKDVPEIRGDLNVKASGTQSLMQREVVTQRILSLVQVAANPLFAPFFNVENAFREIAKNLDLDPDTFVNDSAMAALYAEKIMGGMNANNPGSLPQAGSPPGSPGGGGAAPATGGINPQDATGSGGGNIGVGSAPQSGEAGHSARA